MKRKREKKTYPPVQEILKLIQSERVLLAGIIQLILNPKKKHHMKKKSQ